MPARIADEQLEAWRQFLNAHALMMRLIEQALAAADLPPLSWYDVLWALRRAPDRRLRVHELADELVLSRSGLSRLTDRIERAGHLRREPVAEDRRGASLVLTRSGEQLLRRMWPVYAGVVEAHFAPGTGPSLGRALGRVADSARAELAG